MNEMRKLMESVQALNEDALLVRIAREIHDYIGEPAQPEDLEVYGDGMSYAVLFKPTGEQFLYSKNDDDMFELEDADFRVWPPKVNPAFGTALTKISEKKQLNEYFVKRGMKVGEIFTTILGPLDIQARDAGEENFEPDYLRSLGFEEAADQLEELVDEVIGIKLELQDVWNKPVRNQEIIDELEGVTWHLEASGEYDDEEFYIDEVIPSFEQAIELFATYGADLAR